MPSELANAVAKYAKHLPDYEAAARQLADVLDGVLTECHVHAHVSSRAKSLKSFGQKVLRKGYSDPWREVTDKVAGRVVVYLAADVDRVSETLMRRLGEPRCEDKRGLGDPKAITYSGVHVTGTLTDQPIGGSPVEVEVQIRTAAQHAWAEADHMLIYKPTIELPVAEQRAIARLGVLAELLDEEVSRVFRVLTESPEYDLLPLITLAEELGVGVGIGRGDRRLSLQVLALLRGVVPKDLTGYGTTLASFVQAQSARISHLVEQANAAAASGVTLDFLLVSQPESLIILERLSAAPVALERAWEGSEMPMELLEPFKNLLGVQ